MACRKFHQERHDRMQIRHCSRETLPPTDEAKAYDRRSDTPVYLIFFCYSDAMGPRESPTRASLERAFLATGWRRSSSRHASATSSIWSGLLQFCNSFFVGFGPAPHEMNLRRDAGEKKGFRESRGASAKELGKRWRFFSTYAEVQTSPLLRQPSLTCVKMNVRPDAHRSAFRRSAPAPGHWADQALRQFSRK